MQFLRVAATVGRLDRHFPLAALAGVGALIWGGCFSPPRFGIRASCSSGGSEGWSKSEQYVQECSQSEGAMSPLSGAPCWLSEWSSAQRISGIFRGFAVKSCSNQIPWCQDIWPSAMWRDVRTFETIRLFLTSETVKRVKFSFLAAWKPVLKQYSLPLKK